MNVSTVQVGAIFAAFVIFATLRGNLAKYLEVIGLK